MKYFKFLSIIAVFAGLFAFTSCTEDLNTVPLDDDEITAASVYDDPASYKQVLAKLYAGLAVSGQQGPAGNGDLSGLDEGFGQYLRGYWYLQQLPTDEAIIAWNDGNLRDLHDMDWSASNEFITNMYYRIFYQIAVCNEFIRETTDAKLSDRGVSDALRAEIEVYRAEARFLRALSYWHALDLFANVPFVTEEDNVGAFFPEQISRSDLFSYIETELLDIEGTLIDAKQNEYARADKAAAWTLLAKLYLNAEVYTGTAKNTECITYCKKVLDENYVLETDYENLFLADNHLADGVIFPIAYDGQNTKTWGGTTFLINAAIGGTMVPSDFGVSGGWAGIRTTSGLVNKFDDVSGITDSRAMFHTDGQALEISDIFEFTEGYGITKFKNVTSQGAAGSDGTHPDTDFPMFRIADVYLMYAEAILRGGTGGDANIALGYLNDLRQRAYGDNTGDIASGEMTLDFILDERARELYWECHRRTDLVRFGKFAGTGDYLWPWKGAVADGQAVDDRYNIFPLPSSDVTANSNLTQNPEY